MNREDQFQLQIARDAKEYRDAHGTPDAKGDRVLEFYEAGVFDLHGRGITDPMAQTPAEWLAAHGKPMGSLTRDHVAGDDDTGEFNGRRGGEPASNQFGTFSVHTASPKQIAFIKRLLASKDYSALTPALRIPADIDTISKKSASALIDRLMGCSDKAGAADPAAPKASDKQVAFLRKLIVERDYYSLSEADRAKVDMLNANPDLIPSKRGASELIDTLTTTAYASRPEHAGSKPTAQAALEPGMYRSADGTVYKVYPAQNGGHLLAKRVELIEGWTFETHGKKKANLVYAGAASRFVTAADRMSLDDAKDYGREFAFCCVCGAYLENEESVALGIGPVCGGRV